MILSHDKSRDVYVQKNTILMNIWNSCIIMFALMNLTSVLSHQLRFHTSFEEIENDYCIVLCCLKIWSGLYYEDLMRINAIS